MADKKFSQFTAKSVFDDTDILVGATPSSDNIKMTVAEAKELFASGGNNIGFSEIDTGFDFEESSGSWRPVYQKMISYGALPNNTTKTVAHLISNISKIVNLNGFHTNNTNYRPLPYASPGDTANHVSLSVDAANISIKTGYDLTSYIAMIILQYTKVTDVPTASPRNP